VGYSDRLLSVRLLTLTFSTSSPEPLGRRGFMIVQMKRIALLPGEIMVKVK
jgi:hypothetical protein